MIKLRPYQKEFVDNIRTALFQQERIIACAATGCHAKGTKILMYDGSLKNVEDVCEGDLLMGDDSTKRTVNKLIRGMDLMYRITPVKGDSFIVNGSHILSLKRTTTDKHSRGREPIMNLSVDDYIKTNKNFKHLYKQYRISVDFNSYSENLITHPYFVGLWLGDGTKVSTMITNPDKEVQEWMLNDFSEYCKIHHVGVTIKVVKYGDKCDSIFSTTAFGGGRGNNNNSLLDCTRTFFVNGEKRIPKDYLINSREVRLQVLAGLLDTDGYLGHNGYEIITKYDGLADDILFLARSLGLAAYVTKKIGEIKKLNFKGEYWRISISGDCSIIPCKIERKKAGVRKQIKSVLVTGFSIEQMPIDNFYGFELDANNLYCMGDFTVTHNSGKTKTFLAITKMSIEKGKTVLIISESSKIFKQISEEIGNATEIVSAVKHLDIKPNSIFVAMAQTLVKRPAIVKQLADLGKDLIVITDEAHVGTPKALLLQLSENFHIGFTATPDYKAAKHLPILYNGIVVGAQPQELVEAGFLSPYYHFERKVVNLSNLKKGNNGEFTEQSQEKAFEKKEVFDGVFQDIKKFPFKKCMVFCSSIKHAEDVAHQFRSHGYKIAVVHSKNESSEFELFQFKDINSGVDICISVGVLTKGFDMPSVDLIILLRATTSLPLYLQMCGRGSRISEFTGKKKFTVICYGGNGTRHNLWNYQHDWAELWNKKPKKKADGVAPTKNCPICDCLVPASVMECPSCGHIWVAKPKIEDPKETILVELNLKIKAFRGRRMSELQATELADYAKATNRKPYCVRIAKAKNDMNFLTEFAHRMNYKEQWATINYTDDKVEFHDTTIR